MRTNLEGRFVCSGFNDSHMHLLGYGNSLCSARLAAPYREPGGYASVPEGVYYRENPCAEGEWLMGRGWNQDYFTDADRMPDCHDLDQVSENVPVCAVRGPAVTVWL